MTNQKSLKIFKEIANPNNWCTCDNHLEKWQRFCLYCGVPNHNFDMAKLNREYGCPNGTIEEAVAKGCPHWHRMEQDVPDFKFCPICGFDKLANINADKNIANAV